jgi:transaldolase
MNAKTPTRDLHDLGQSLWLDNITRDLLDNGTLARYIAELSVTGLTSNPTIFAGAIGGSKEYDSGIAAKTKAGQAWAKPIACVHESVPLSLPLSVSLSLCLIYCS